MKYKWIFSASLNWYNRITCKTTAVNCHCVIIRTTPYIMQFLGELEYITCNQYASLSSTLPEIDPDTAYVVSISVSLGFRQKPSDTALLSVIALTTFNCVVSASVTKGALVCFVVPVHWWRHRTHYDVTEAYRALRNILTVHSNNGATRADLRGISKHYEVTGESRPIIDNIYGWFWCDFLYQ